MRSRQLSASNVADSSGWSETLEAEQSHGPGRKQRVYHARRGTRNAISDLMIMSMYVLR